MVRLVAERKLTFDHFGEGLAGVRHEHGAVLVGAWRLGLRRAALRGVSHCIISAQFLIELVVRIDIRQGRARFGLLETVRHYAWDRLADRPGEPTRTRQRHAAYFSALVEHLDPAAPTMLLTYSGSSETLTAPIFDVLNDPHDNLRVALRYWLDARRPTDGLVLLRAFGALWQWHGIPVDGPRWIEAMLDLAEAPTVTPAELPALHASALMFGAIVARLQGDYARMRTLSDASVALWRSVDDRIGLAQALTSQATYHLICGDAEEAGPILNEGLLLAHAAG